MTNKLLYFFGLVFLACSLTAANQPLNLIPQPESVILKKGNFILSSETKVFIPKEFKADMGSYLSEKLKNDLGFGLDIISGKPSKVLNAIRFEKSSDSTITEEGYILVITPEYILVKANSYAGMFYGFQTLRQLFPLNKENRFELPCLIINDNPRFAWRGMMLDVARHFQTKEFVMKQIDEFASYKINKFHWHLTDDQGWRIEIKKYPNLTKKGAWRADRTGIPWWKRDAATADEPKTVGGFYTQQDIKEVIEYARVRNVEIIPEIDVPGHSKALVASYPFLSCLENAHFEVAVGGKAPNNTLCPGKETTYQFMNNVIGEVAKLFPSKYIHIGGDECNKANWLKCPQCQKLMADKMLKDVEELQSYFIGRMNEMITAKHKTMIGWDEILSGKGAKGATIMAWRRNKYTPEIDAPREGYPTIMADYIHSYLSQVQGPNELEPEGPKVILPLSKVYSYEPIPKELTDEESKRVLGTEACLWGEFTPTPEHCEYMLYPRTLANAEVGWSQPSVRNWGRFQKAVETQFKRFDRDGINYSTSLYNIYASYALDKLHDKAMVYLLTETVGYDIFYTYDGTEPTVNSKKYNGVVAIPARGEIKAGLFDHTGKLLGKITKLKLR